MIHEKMIVRVVQAGFRCGNRTYSAGDLVAVPTNDALDAIRYGVVIEHREPERAERAVSVATSGRRAK